MIFPQMKRKKTSYTIIVGCGGLGANLAQALSDEGEEVLILDRNEAAFHRLSSLYKGLTFVGDGMEWDVLKDVHIDEADALVAVTDSDNAIIMIALLGREMFRVKNVVAQRYDPESECVYQAFGIETICPAVLSARMIDKLLMKQSEACEA